MAASRRRAAAALALLLLTAACGPRRLSLPTGPGTPLADYDVPFRQARAICDGLQTWQGELGLSGRAGRQRLRGRVLAGIVPDAMRLEGVAPFGAPAFILVADGADATLLLPRDRRVVRAAPQEILDAMLGVRVDPNDLRFLLAGCVRAAADAVSARAHGGEWIVVQLSGNGEIVLRRQPSGWRIVAGRADGLEVEYPQFAGLRPSVVLVRGPAVELSVSVQQVEINGALPRAELVAVKIPDGTLPLALDELRASGPLAPAEGDP